MSIQFFIHTPLPDDMNERRALVRAARLLYQQFAPRQDESWLLIANLDPTHDPAWQNLGLTQLDGLLLGQKAAVILECKNYYEPITAASLTSRWFAGRQIVAAGSKNNLNPYEQVKKARSAWMRHLMAQKPEFAWDHLGVFLLFHPYLDSKSKFPLLGQDHYWLQIDSIETIVQLANNTSSPKLSFSPEALPQLAQTLFHAQPWTDMETLLVSMMGYLHIQPPGREPYSYPLYRYDEWLIGRGQESRQQATRMILLSDDRISRPHARIEVRQEAIRLYDLGSKNGTFRGNWRVEGESGVQLQPGEHIFLGSHEPEKAHHLWFEPLSPVAEGLDEDTRTA